MNADGIAEFLAVARAGSFTGAARILDVSVPHVSRQVRRLEADIGVKLFQRSTRSVRLTEAGARLRRSCEQISSDLDHALDAVRADETALTGRLRIAAPSGSFEASFLADALAAFAKRHPAIELDVDVSPRMVDLIHEGYDLAIRAEIGDRAGLVCRPLVRRTRVAAASPDYLRIHGIPARPADLRHHTCIKTYSNTWAFTENGRRREIAVQGRLRFNSGPSIRAACEAGLGIAYMVAEGFGDALTTGRLVPVLEPFWRNDAVIYAVHPAAEHLPRRLSHLVSHLEEWAAAA